MPAFHHTSFFTSGWNYRTELKPHFESSRGAAGLLEEAPSAINAAAEGTEEFLRAVHQEDHSNHNTQRQGRIKGITIHGPI
ncbi:MAG TPA: hypothetical protein VJ302_30895 [Blastocatellia bacterium]|nr:hypothetical protein [Blastocatellia bacterium]